MNFFLASDISNEISEKVSENNVENLKKVSSLFDNCYFYYCKNFN